MPCNLDKDYLDFNNAILTKKEEVIKAYWEVFKNSYGLNDEQAGALEESINQIQLKIRRLKRAINKGTGGRTVVSENKKKYDSLQRQLVELEKKFAEYAPKRKIIKRIEKMIVNHVMHVQENGLFKEMVDPVTLMKVMKDTMQLPRSIMFDKLSDLDNSTLLSIESQMASELHTLKQLSEKESKLTWYQDQIMHPLAISRMLDPTGNSYKVIKSTIDLATNAYSSRSQYEVVVSEVMQSIATLVGGDKNGDYPFMFMHDVGDLKPTEEDQAISMDNIVKFLHEIGDKELVKLIPRPIVGYNAAGELTYTKDFLTKREQSDGSIKSDYTLWREAIQRQIDSGLEASGDIQKYTHRVGDQERTYYYLMIERTDEEGRVFNVAYEVPFEEFETKSGDKVDRLTFPPNKKNVKKYQEWFQRNPSEHLGGVFKYDVKTGEAVLEPGRMIPGWYRARDYKNFTGLKSGKKQREKGEKFTGQTYIDYQIDEDMNNQERKSGYGKKSVFGMPAELFDLHHKLNEMFQQVAQDIIENNKKIEARMKIVLKNIVGGDEEKIDLRKININELIAEKMNVDIDLLNMNINVTGNTLKDARIWTVNSEFSERRNYMPIIYSDPDKISMLLKSRQKAISMRDKVQKDYDRVKNEVATEENVKEKNKLKDRLKELNTLVVHEDATVKRVLGMSPNVPKVNQITAVKAAKHRSSQSNPLEQTTEVTVNGETTTEVTNHGRRKDSGVFSDYLQQTYISMEQNEVKMQLLEALDKGMSETMKEYTIDQVKASFGRDDVKAGFLFLDYSDVKMMLNETGTLNDVGYLLDVNNKLLSANLLKSPVTALVNNFQRMGYGIVSDMGLVLDAMEWRTNPANAKEVRDAAAFAGITDEITTIADGLIPGNLSAEGQEHWLSGFWNKAIMGALVLSSSRSDFIKKTLRGSGMVATFWQKTADFLVYQDVSRFGIDIKKPLSEQQQQLFEAREEALSDMWLLTRGLAIVDEDTGEVIDLIPKEERPYLDKKLGRTFANNIINSHLQFSLQGGALMHLWGARPGMLKFTESEKNMRIESLYIAAEELKRKGTIDPELKSINLYKHPKVVAHARLLVNNVMFSMSTANLPKMFRGKIGKTLFKFKPYMWNQMGAEYNIMQSWWYNVANENLNIADRMNVIKDTLINPKGPEQKQMRSLFVTRGLATAVTTTGTHMIFGAKFARTIMRRMFGYAGVNVATRGADFQIMKVLMNAFLTGLMFSGAWGDEDEKVYQEFRRNFYPIFVNIILDTWRGEDPWRGVRVYSTGLYNMIDMIREFKNSQKVATRGMY